MTRCITRFVVRYDVYIQVVIVIDNDYDAKKNSKNENEEDVVCGRVTWHREIQNVQTILKGIPFCGEFVVHHFII
jgi:predicted ATP-dependent endonuclease of OLD family